MAFGLSRARGLSEISIEYCLMAPANTVLSALADDVYLP